MGELKRGIGFWTIVALTITSMIGTGIFQGTKLAAQKAGTASIFSWLFMALVTLYVAFIFGELVSLFPRAGGVYEYAKRAYGRFPSFLIGWVTWIVSNLTTAVLIVLSVNFIFPGGTAIEQILLSAGIILLFNAVTYFGIEASGFILNLFALISMVLLLGLFFPGLFLIEWGNFSNILGGNYLFVGLAVFFIVETFFGWESAGFLAEETKNPEKVIPRALVVSTLVVILLGVGLATITMGVFPLDSLLRLASPVMELGTMIYGEASHGILNMMIFLTLVGSAAGGVISSPRLLVALGRDKQFPDKFSHIHPRFKTPDNAIIFQTIVTILVIIFGFGNYTVILSMLVPMALLMYVAVIIALPILRKKYPGKRAFSAPFGNFLPWVVALLYLAVVAIWLFTEPSAFSIFRLILSFIFFGLPIYLLLAFFYDPVLLMKITDRLAPFHVWFENFAVPKKLRLRLISLFQDLRGKTILELGAGVGTITLRLAESVGMQGKVIAVDLSNRNLELLGSRLRKHGFSHVDLIRDEHMNSRIHPDVPIVDAVFSIGHLGYVQDEVRYLKDIADNLPDHGKVCFVEFTDFFMVIPNKQWLSDDKLIKETFRKAGLSVNIVRDKSILWTTVLIYGIKTDYDVPVV